MAGAVDWIGAFSFLSLEGVPQSILEHPTQVVRPGVNGSATWLGGVWGDRFTLRSKLDCYHLNHAETLYRLYRTLVGEFADLIWRNIAMTDANTKVVVADMKRVAQYPCIYGVGGLSPPSQAWLECDWTLYAVYVAPT